MKATWPKREGEQVTLPPIRGAPLTSTEEMKGKTDSTKKSRVSVHKARRSSIVDDVETPPIRKRYSSVDKTVDSDVEEALARMVAPPVLKPLPPNSPRGRRGRRSSGSVSIFDVEDTGSLSYTTFVAFKKGEATSDGSRLEPARSSLSSMKVGSSEDNNLPCSPRSIMNKANRSLDSSSGIVPPIAPWRSKNGEPLGRRLSRTPSAPSTPRFSGDMDTLLCDDEDDVEGDVERIFNKVQQMKV